MIEKNVECVPIPRFHCVHHKITTKTTINLELSILISFVAWVSTAKDFQVWLESPVRSNLD